MKRARKLVSLLLVLTMILSMSVVSSAAPAGVDPTSGSTEVTPENNDMMGTGTAAITVSNASQGHTYSVYQMLYKDGDALKANPVWVGFFAGADAEEYVTYTEADKTVKLKDGKSFDEAFSSLAMAYVAQKPLAATKTTQAPAIADSAAGTPSSAVVNTLSNGVYLVDTVVPSTCDLSTENAAEVTETHMAGNSTQLGSITINNAASEQTY